MVVTRVRDHGLPPCPFSVWDEKSTCFCIALLSTIGQCVLDSKYYHSNNYYIKQISFQIVSRGRKVDLFGLNMVFH